MYRFNERQLEKFIKHISGIAILTAEAMRDESENEEPEPFAGVGCEDLNKPFGILEIEPFDVDLPPAEPKPFTIYDYDDEDNVKRVEVMSRLCGRWATKGTRGDIEIERRGEHFILHYLKRNGARTEDRYVLLWYFGEVYYHCPVCRVTVLALDGDTLMISPGVDYTRVVEPEQ